MQINLEICSLLLTKTSILLLFFLFTTFSKETFSMMSTIMSAMRASDRECAQAVVRVSATVELAPQAMVLSSPHSPRIQSLSHKLPLSFSPNIFSLTHSLSLSLSVEPSPPSTLTDEAMASGGGESPPINESY